jgi:hypothetical protein
MLFAKEEGMAEKNNAVDFPLLSAMARVYLPLSPGIAYRWNTSSVPLN